jgi:hypothetical protein
MTIDEIARAVCGSSGRRHTRRFGGRLGRNLDVRSRSAALHGRRHPGLEERRAPAFDAHDPNISLAEIVDQLLELSPIDFEVCDVENDRPPQEKARGSRGQIVESGEPSVERRLR